MIHQTLNTVTWRDETLYVNCIKDLWALGAVGGVETSFSYETMEKFCAWVRNPNKEILVFTSMVDETEIEEEGQKSIILCAFPGFAYFAFYADRTLWGGNIMYVDLERLADLMREARAAAIAEVDEPKV